MVKLPVGARVTIDLWDPQKRQGIAKHFSDTLDLVRAESEFELKRGDNAIVVNSYDSYVMVIPENEYSKLIIQGGKNLDLVGLNRVIYNLLKDQEKSTGGIMLVENILSYMLTTPLKYLITEDLIKKTVKIKGSLVELVKHAGMNYVGVPVAELNADKQVLLNFAKTHEFVTMDMIQAETGWKDVRILRIMENLTITKRIRKESTYKDGVRYYFIQL